MFHVNGTGRVRRRPWLAAPLLLSAAFPDPAGAQSEDTGVCDRTEQVRDAIAEAVLGVTDCADITATHLGQVTSLYLFAVNIGALKSGDFGGLTALDSLNLGFNDLRTLPADIFDGLASLEYLNLGHNELVLLPNSVFVGLTSLTTLLLGGNPGHPFGPIPEAGPRWNVRPDMEVSLSGSATDPWGRDVTYAWSQSDTSGATVSLDGANTATATLIAPALEKATLLEFTLTVVAVNPGGVRPVGTTAAGDTAQDVAGVNVRAAEPVTATFVQADYTATEGGAAATVGVRLNRIPERSVSIPLMATHAGGATEADYSIPASVTFAFADRVKYVTVTATDDTVDDNGESLTLGFGTLPPAVTAGSPSTVEVTLADNDRAVTGLAVTSDPGTDATYTLGDTIKVTATFGEAVTVTGQPQLTMRVGSAIQIAFGRADRAASYQSGSATDELVFAYVVAAGDTDPDGVSVADGSLSLNGGTLEYGGGTSAGLEHGALDEQTGHKVDAIAPTFVEAFVDGATLTLRFSKTLDEDSSPAGGVFAVTVGGTTRTVNAVGVDEKFVTLTLASPVVPADTVKVGYNAPTTSPIRDRAGFKAASFANKAVTNHTLPAVSIAAIDPAVYEGEDIDFRLTRTGRFAQSLRVGVRVEDGGDVLDGAAGDRYVTFGVGDTTAVLTVATLDDHAYEAHTTVTGTLFEVANYTISETASAASAASVKVSDNDVPEIDILLEAADSVAEGAGDLEVRIIARTVADDEPHGSVTVRLRSTAGTATAGADGDFGEVNQTVRFAVSDFERVDEEGTANYVATLTHDVTIHDDTDEEDDETFTLRLSKLGGIQVDLNLSGEPLVVTIVDDDMVVRPGKVTGLSVTEGDEELVLSWTAVSGATGYKVQWKSGTETFADAATDGRQHLVSGGATTTSTIAGLTNGTQYATRVIATNSAGDGDASDERTGTPRAPVTTPGKVTGLSVTEGDEELVLSWTAVSGATGYKVQWKSGTETFADAATDGRQHVVSGGATTTSAIAGLTNGTQYATRVIATNSAGDGDASDERTGTPRAPVTTPGKVTGLSVTEGDEELVLSWTAVSGATGYKVQWKSGTETFADAATDGRQHVVSGGATTTSAIAGLTNGTQYATRVIATNSAGDGDASDERTGTPRAPVTTPGKVTGLSVTEGDEELVLSWTAVSGATGYKVQWKSGTETFADAATDGRQHVVSGGATTTSTIAGLTNGTQYATRVIATNSAGDGDASDERTGTPRAPVTTPGKVTGLSVTEGDEELVLSWTAVSGATGYKVQWKSGTETFADAATDGREHVVSGGATTTQTISGLTNGTQYATRVIATNSAGDGDASDERTGTPRAPVTTPEIRTTTLAMSLVEGDSSTYQVALESAPTGPVTVTVGGWSGTDVSVAPTSFAFSGSNWNEWRTVTVRAEQDDEHEATHEVTLTHSAGTGTSGPTVRVTVVDEDGPLPKLSLRALKDSVTEGDRSHFEITRTGTLDQSLRAGIMVQDLEEGNWVDELIAVYFHPGHATRSVSYKVKVDTLTTTERTLKAWINAMLDGYEVGDPSSAVVHVIDDTSGDAAPRIGISFKQAPQVTAKEGEQGAPVIVRLSEPTADAVAIPIVARGMGGAGEGDWNVPSDVVIEAGESEGTVLVSAVDDAEEDPGESIELSFGTLPRGMVTEDPGSLVVDIEDNDQFRLGSGEARAWLARFGRAAADDAMLAVRERLAAMQRPVTGSQQVTVGGYDVSAWRQALFSGHGMANTPESSPSRDGHAGAQADGTASGFFSRLFSGASFLRTRNSGRDGSNRWSVWGRGGFSGFAGQDGALSLSGDLTTATLGADYASGRALAGVVLSRITADGHLTGGSGASGSVETSLTATYPWLHYALTDRLSVWGMGGYGTGSMPRSPGDVAAGADVRMWMGSVGAAGQLVTRGSFTLGLSADAMFTRTTTEGATRLGEVRANVGRVRMMLEGSSSLRTGGGILRPSFEVGFRQDGGDAETGMGLAVGGGGGYSLPSLGLTVEARGRGLVAHQDSGYEEWGVSGSLRIAPDASGRGLNLALSPSWGSAAGGEARALWSRRNMAGIASNRGDPGQPVDGRRLALDLGYGLAVSGSIVATPYTGTMSDARRVGLRMKAGSSVEVALERMERDGRGALLLNAGYRPRPHFDFTLEAGRNAAGEIRLGLRGNARW